MAQKFGWYNNLFGLLQKSEYTTVERVYSGVRYNESLFQCCGLGQLSGMCCGSVDLTKFEDKAAWLAGLYTGTQSGRKQLMFTVTNAQINKRYKKSYQGLWALIEAGAVEIHKCKNQQPGHSRNTLYTYCWNPRDAIGVFYNANGVPFTTPPEKK